MNSQICVVLTEAVVEVRGEQEEAERSTEEESAVRGDQSRQLEAVAANI